MASATRRHFLTCSTSRLIASRQPASPRIEVLNFGTGNSQVIHRHVLVDRKVFAFGPDALYYIATSGQNSQPLQTSGKTGRQRGTLPYPCLSSIVQSAGIEVRMNREERSQIEPFAAEIVKEFTKTW